MNLFFTVADNLLISDKMLVYCDELIWKLKYCSFI